MPGRKVMAITLGLTGVSVGYAWANRASGDLVLMWSGAGLFFLGLAVLFGAAVRWGSPAPRRVGGLCLVVSGGGALVSWWGGRDVWATTPGGWFVGPMVLLLGGLLSAWGLWGLAGPSTSQRPQPTPAGHGGRSAIQAARARYEDAVDADLNREAAHGPGWVWFPGDVLIGDPEAGCWDWYTGSETWPAGRESAHVLGPDATEDELRLKATGLLGRPGDEVRLALARQSLEVQPGKPTPVFAYLVR